MINSEARNKKSGLFYLWFYVGTLGGVTEEESEGRETDGTPSTQGVSEMLIPAGRNLSFKSEKTALVCNQEVSSPRCIFIPASSELWQLTWLVSAIRVERSIKVTGHHSLCSSWAMIERKNKPEGGGSKIRCSLTTAQMGKGVRAFCTRVLGTLLKLLTLLSTHTLNLRLLFFLWPWLFFLSFCKNPEFYYAALWIFQFYLSIDYAQIGHLITGLVFLS